MVTRLIVVSLCSKARLGCFACYAYLLGVANQQLLGVAQRTFLLLLSCTCVTCRVPVWLYRSDLTALATYLPASNARLANVQGFVTAAHCKLFSTAARMLAGSTKAQASPSSF
jgi:hypothetical protein